MTKDFQMLYSELLDAGYFKPSYSHVLFRFFEVAFLITAGLFMCQSRSIYTQIMGAALFGIGVGRSGWLMHEGGHHSLTGIPNVDRFLQSFSLGNFFT